MDNSMFPDHVQAPQATDAAPASPPPEDSTRCMIVHVETLNELAAACDYGWLGISDETVNLLSSISSEEDGPKKNVVVIVSIPSRRSVTAYGIYLGAITKRSAMKEAQRRDLPSHWTSVARIGWVRVGEATWECIANSKPTTAPLIDVFTTAASNYTAAVKNVGSTDNGSSHPSTWIEIVKGGDIVCASVDNASLQVLPHDLRDLHLNPQAAKELADRNNATQAQRQQQYQDRSRQGGSYGHGTPGYQTRINNFNPQQQTTFNSNRQSNFSNGQPQQYYGQQQQQQAYGQYQQQPQPQQQAPAAGSTQAEHSAAWAQYYQYLNSLTPEQQVAYQQYVAQCQQMQQEPSN